MKQPTDIDCSEVLEGLPLFVGGDLESDRLPVFEAHLASCASCAEEAARAQRARDVFRQALDESMRTTAGAGLWASLRTELAAEGHFVEDGVDELPQAVPIDAPAPRAFARGGWGALAGLAAAVALVFVIQSKAPTSDPLAPVAGGSELAEGLAQSAAPTTLVRDGAGDEASTGGLRRVRSGDPTLFQGAQPFSQDAPGGAGRAGRASTGTTLVHYR